MEKGDSYDAIAESCVDSVKGIMDKRQWGSMATKTVIITKTKRTGNVNHIGPNNPHDHYNTTALIRVS
ncbi:hypothetical protein DPMN_168386 [Dreissena polymorpha]|uniref:Uncharacterized protein n=1 Tax=Dreissena polymorpha TaxID=45954 RepID=A0A9D4IX66_DREPO|nr:hypothetical protein DPMN_168386 [Dreissena polymorpha]